MYVIFVISLIASALERNLVISESWSDFLVQQISNDMVTHQLVVLRNKTIKKDAFAENLLLKNLLKEIPAIFIDLNELKYSSDNRLLSSPIFINPRQSSLYIILKHENNKINNFYSDLKNIINFLSSIAPVYTRPRTLVIFYQESNKNSDASFWSTFKFAWKNKFLDFSVIKINKNGSILTNAPVVYNFNPFFNLMNKGIFYSNVTIFPNKLKNVNGYPLKIPIFDSPPFIVLLKDRSGKNITVKGIMYPITSVTAKHMNFTLDQALELTERVPIMNWLELVRDQLNESSLDMLSIPTVSFVSGDFQQVYVESQCIEYVALVPVMYSTKLNFPLSHLSNLFLITFIFITVIYLLNETKINQEYFRLTDVLKITFGKIVDPMPRKTVNRVMFLTISFMYIVYCNILLSRLIDANVVKYEKPFETFEEIYNSKLKVFVEKIFFDRIFNNTDNHYVLGIKNNTVAVKDIEICIKKLKRQYNCICIINNLKAKTLISDYVKNHRSTLMKIAKPVFGCERLAFPLQKGSPYGVKFNEIFRYIMESGMEEGWEMVQRMQRTPNYKAGEKETEGDIKALLYSILIGESLISIIALIVEFHASPEELERMRRLPYILLERAIEGIVVGVIKLLTGDLC